MSHFTLLELSRSDTARAKGIDNSIPSMYKGNALELITKILDPLTNAYGSEIIVTSAYRCDALNDAIRGSKTSAHSVAYAADMVPASGKIDEFKQFVMKWLYENNIVFDLFINEYSKTSQWVHIGLKNREGHQRKEYLLYIDGTYYGINPVTFRGVLTPSNRSTNNFYYSNNSSDLTSARTAPEANYSASYGTLTGKSIYLNDIDKEAIQNNKIFLTSESGDPIYDEETGKFVVNDNYLLEVDETVGDTMNDITDVERYLDNYISELESTLTSDEVETMRGASIDENGSYVIRQSKTLRELMQMFQKWWELVCALKRSSDNVDKTLIDEQLDEKLVINAQVYFKSEFDRYGHAFVSGAGCPVCGKRMKYLPPGGYCSTKCLLADITNKVKAYLMSPNDKYKDFEKDITTIEAILDLMTLILNAISMIPDIISELASIPDEYKDYVMSKINEGFCLLQVLILKLMIWKNKIMTKLLLQIKFGWITKPLSYMLSWMQGIINAIDAIKKFFMSVYDPAMAVIQGLAQLGPIPFVGGLSIEAASHAWAVTPRSFMSIYPAVSPDMGKIFVNLPGGGGGIPLLVIKGVMPSGMLNINFQAIDSAIQALFPPLTPLDYYLEPELFKVRYLLSDLGTVIAELRQLLEDFLVVSPMDYLPKFENLFPVKIYHNFLPNINYVWFVLGLMDSWAPHGKALVGSILNPLV